MLLLLLLLGGLAGGHFFDRNFGVGIARSQRSLRCRFFLALAASRRFRRLHLSGLFSGSSQSSKQALLATDAAARKLVLATVPALELHSSDRGLTVLVVVVSTGVLVLVGVLVVRMHQPEQQSHQAARQPPRQATVRAAATQVPSHPVRRGSPAAQEQGGQPSMPSCPALQ